MNNLLNRHNLEIAALAPIPDDETRGELCGVYVTTEATYITDGRLAVMVTLPEVQPSLFPQTDGIQAAEQWTPFIIDRETALKIARSIPKKGEPETQPAAIDVSTEVNGTAIIATNEHIRQGIMRSQKVEGTFPNVEKVIPSPGKTKFTIDVNPELLLNLMKIIGGFCKAHDSHRLTMRFTADDQAIRFDVDGVGQKLTAALMPLRRVDG